jgi:hypothetical protein
MNQIDTGHYNVVQGEVVTLTIVANKVNEDVAVSLDGNSQTPASTHPLVYNFPVTAPTGAQFIDIECHFTSQDNKAAYYQFYVQGSKGGGKFNASNIRKTDGDWEADLQFALP